MPKTKLRGEPAQFKIVHRAASERASQQAKRIRGSCPKTSSAVDARRPLNSFRAGAETLPK